MNRIFSSFPSLPGFNWRMMPIWTLLLALCLPACRSTNGNLSENNPDPAASKNLAVANRYYVDPDGDDQAPGTRQHPWATLEHVSRRAMPGDTIIFLEGDYPGTLAPLNSGTPENPVVFKADLRRSVRFTGNNENPYPILLQEREHLRLEGFHIIPGFEGGRWLLMEQCRNIELEDLLFEDGYSGMPFQITDSRLVWIKNSVFRRNAFNMARISNSDQIIFEGNAVSRAGHSPLQIFPPNSNNRLVVRGNVFHAGWGRPFEFFTTPNVLFEDNIITHAYNSGRSASSNAKFSVQGGIFRFNRVFGNFGGALEMYSWDNDPLKDIRVYHNIFHDNVHYGMQIRGMRGGVATRNVRFQNNVFSENDPHGAGVQLQVISGSPEAVSVISNLFHSSLHGSRSEIEWNNEGHSVAEVQNPLFFSRFDNVFQDNVYAEPQFINASQKQFGTRTTSPLRNGGSPLSRARGNGNGNILPVNDILVFYDGFGIPGEQGDRICVENCLQQAQILEIRADEKELLLDRTVTWSNGDAVSLVWDGYAPDIGVYEYGSGRDSPEIRISPFRAVPGEAVEMELVIHGSLEPKSIQWQLGDGTLVRDHFRFHHTYQKEYDYPVRVEITDSTGRRYRSTALVMVENPGDEKEPLLQSTFCTEDTQWWWRWQSYRPMPAAWERILVLEEGEQVPPPWSHPRGNNRVIPPDDYHLPGSGWLRAFAPEDGGRLPVQVFPANWNIDQYPTIHIRYRLSPGTPVGLYLSAFPVPGSSRRQKWLAASPVTSRSQENSGLPQLHDDGQWHTLVLDARIIRDIYPDVEIVQGLHFWSEDPERVREGQRLELDEVFILPLN